MQCLFSLDSPLCLCRCKNCDTDQIWMKTWLLVHLQMNPAAAWIEKDQRGKWTWDAMGRISGPWATFVVQFVPDIFPAVWSTFKSSMPKWTKPNEDVKSSSHSANQTEPWMILRKHPSICRFRFKILFKTFNILSVRTHACYSCFCCQFPFIYKCFVLTSCPHIVQHTDYSRPVLMCGTCVLLWVYLVWVPPAPDSF